MAKPSKPSVRLTAFEDPTIIKRENGIKNISGLMCIPPIKEDPEKHFKLISSLSNELGLGRPSIGMSSDYLEALKFDPQYIRLGTVLFGKRV